MTPKPRLLDKAVRHEFGQSALGIFVALFAILLTTQLIRLLNEAAAGKLPAEAVLALLGFASLNYLPIVLSITTFMAILLALVRSFRDSEMIVWFSSGLPLTYWFVPVLKFSTPISLVIATMSLFLSPWALSQSAQFRSNIREQNKISQVSPGDFYEMNQGKRVVFVERLDADQKKVRNIFIQETDKDMVSITVAKTGYSKNGDNNQPYVILENGSSYQLPNSSNDYQHVLFDRMGVRVLFREKLERLDSPRFLSMPQLLTADRRDFQAELLWRLGLPISCWVLAFIAIPLAYMNPRAPRSANLLFAIMLYAVYFNLISISKSWVEQGHMPFWLGSWCVHGAMLCIVPILLWYHTSNFNWRRFFTTHNSK